LGQPVTLSIDQGLATVRLERAHGNAINDELVRGLMTACQETEADPEVRGVLLAGGGKLFCPGLDLQELVELDRATMVGVLHRFNACILMLYTHSKPVVAALHGHAVAGGCVLSLTADWRVLRQGAMVGLNEVKVGVPFPFGVSMVLRESVPRASLEEVVMFGRNYRDDEAIRAGLVHEVRPAEGFEQYCLERLQELADKDPRAFAITKRYLRSATAERIRANDPQLAEEFLDSWFSTETRQKIKAIVAALKKPKL
jgi:enoyl-CoA hydratase